MKQSVPEMVQMILDLSDVPNRAKYKAHLEKLRPELLESRLTVLQVQAKLPVKTGNWRERQKCFLDERFYKEACK